MSDKIKILVAYDGSASARAALADMQVAGLPMNVDALVVSVAEKSLPLPAAAAVQSTVSHYTLNHYAKILSQARDLASQACEYLRSQFPTWSINQEARLGSAAEEILNKADKWQPELIVVGAQGITAHGAFTLGSISQTIIQEACCSVRVGRAPRRKRDSPVKLIIGIDGSENACAAAEKVAKGVWPRGSEVRLVTAIDSENMKAIAHAQDLQQSPKLQLLQMGLNVSNIIRFGNPKKILWAQSQQFDADCIYLGSVGRVGFNRIIIGSVAMAMAARANCAVEIVRPAHISSYRISRATS